MKYKTKLNNFIKRVFLSIIIFLTIGILLNRNDKFLLFYKNNIYDKSLNFNIFNGFIEKYFGNIKIIDENAIITNKENTYSNYNNYKDGAVLNDISSVYPFKSGIVVFIGNKEEYGNTIIIQGMDGIDYWYSNVTDINVKLYDYVESNNIICNAENNKLYVVFMKDGKVLDYNDYL